MDVYLYVLALLCIISVCDRVNAMGLIGTLTIQERVRCYTIDEDNSPYPIYFTTSNSVNTISILSNTFQQSSLEIHGWPDDSQLNSTTGCKLHNGTLYMVGEGGLVALIDISTGNVLFHQSNLTNGRETSKIVISSILPSSSSNFNLFYAMEPFSPTAYLVDLNANPPTSSYIPLPDIPLGGYATGGYVYFWTANTFLKINDPNLTRIGRHEFNNVTVSSGYVSSPQNKGFFAAFSMERCQIYLYIVDLQKMGKETDRTLRSANMNGTNCPAEVPYITTAVSGEYLYVNLMFYQFTYKISLEDYIPFDEYTATNDVKVYPLELLAPPHSFWSIRTPEDEPNTSVFVQLSLITCTFGDGSIFSNGTCTTCPPGYIPSMSYSATTCDPCKMGTYNYPNTGLCLSCPKGTYGDQRGLSACPECPPGKVSTQVGAITCTTCPPGTDSSKHSFCDNCTVGSYAPSEATPKCLVCPVDTYTDKKGQRSCISCSSGSYQQYTNKSYCNACSSDLWNSTGNCTPVAQISIGMAAFAVLVMAGLAYLYKRRTSSDRYMKIVSS